MKIVLIKARTR